MNILEIGERMTAWKEQLETATKKERKAIIKEMGEVLDSGWTIPALCMYEDESFEENESLPSGANVKMAPSLTALITCCDCGLAHKLELLYDSKTSEPHIAFYRDDATTRKARDVIGTHACPICWYRGGDDEHYEGKESGDNQE